MHTREMKWEFRCVGDIAFDELGNTMCDKPVRYFGDWYSVCAYQGFKAFNIVQINKEGFKISEAKSLPINTIVAVKSSV